MLNITITSPSNIIKEAKAYLAQEVRAFSNELLSQLRQATPIAPVKGGRARAGWSQKQTNTYQSRLSNRVPYIERLENNYSKQTRGRGIMKPAIANTVASRQRRNTR
jgi:hypothetical protein